MDKVLKIAIIAVPVIVACAIKGAEAGKAIGDILWPD